MRLNNIHLVYATDMGFLLPTKVSAASAIAHSSRPRDVIIDVLDCGLDDSGWDDLVATLRKFGPSEVHRYVIDMKRFYGFKKYRGNLGVYARLDIPEIITDVDWCCYVDGDTLFLDDPLKLLRYCKGDLSLLGHKDMGGSDEQVAWYKRNGLLWRPDDYVCAGFILMNLKWMRANNITRKCLDFLGKHTDTPLNDQDVLNIFCQDGRALLPPEWGVFNVESFVDGRIPKCVHYAFGKPWDFSVKWTRCLLDVDRLWFRAARKYCGIGICSAGATKKDYARRWLRSLAHKFFLKIVCCSKKGLDRWGNQRRYYSPVGLGDMI